MVRIYYRYGSPRGPVRPALAPEPLVRPQRERAAPRPTHGALAHHADRPPGYPRRGRAHDRLRRPGDGPARAQGGAGALGIRSVPVRAVCARGGGGGEYDHQRRRRRDARAGEGAQSWAGFAVVSLFSSHDRGTPNTQMSIVTIRVRLFLLNVLNEATDTRACPRNKKERRVPQQPSAFLRSLPFPSHF